MSRSAAEILPACSHLGYALNMASLDIDPTDFRSVFNKSSLIPIVEIDKTNTSDVTPPGSKITYSLPGNTKYDNLGSESKNNELVTEIGKEITDKFNTSVDFGVSYSGIGLTSGTQYSYSSSLKSTTAYGVYSFDQQVYGARLDQAQWHEHVNVKLLTALQALPNWNLDDPSIYQKYMSFFNTWGTHFVSRSYMGNRYQLMVYREELTESSVSKFNLQIKAEFAGVIKGGGGSWGSEKEKEEYLSNRRVSCLVRGGEPAAGGELANNPTSKDAFTEWQKTRDAAYDAYTSVQIHSIAVFLENSTDPAHKAAGEKLSPALDYCCNFASLHGKLAFEVTGGSPLSVQWGECKLTPLPGLEITAMRHPEWRIEPVSTAHVKIVRSGIGSSNALIDITVKAPPKEVDVTLNAAFASSGSDEKIYRFFVLSPYGPLPRQHRTLVMTYRKSGEESINTVKPSLQAWGVFNN
ncbi:hypothetical protein BDV36DRAFT_274945 [Aspergillus pseudocaelatus]|uniref:MACPF domain-containing protein n=1 Tax=Aspergillus pseudocaelatus TaxID=1825620 RepID=A0ABQ6W2P0_9EURO|nr:hypothetical protein BDV36DRAFT_274945 [Aspergillus pseudocaelatus]